MIMVLVSKLANDIQGRLTMVAITRALPEKSVAEIPAAVKQGILDGFISHQIEAVTITAKSSPTKKDETRQFDAFYALTIEGMAILSGGKFETQTPTPEGKDDRTDEQKRYGACDHYNYGRLLNVRQSERSKLETSIEGPEKQITKNVKNLLAGGMADSEQAAREMAITRMKALGNLPADYVWPGEAPPPEPDAPPAE